MTPPLDALGPVRVALAHYARGERPDAPEVDVDDRTVGALCAAFGLSPFERNVLLLCAGVELDEKIATTCGGAATFGFAREIFPDADPGALAPSGPLRYWRLVDVGAGPLAVAPLRIEERVLHHLAGVDALDDRLAGFVRRSPLPDDVVPSHRTVAERVAEAWEADLAAVVQLCGGAAGDRRAVAGAACATRGCNPNLLAASAVPASASELDAFLRLWGRETKLGGGALVIECDDLDGDPARAAAVTRLLDGISGPVVVSAREPHPCPHRAAVLLDVAHPTQAEAIELWRAALAPAEPPPLDGLTAQFRLSAPAIRAAAADALTRPESLDRSLWAACRAQARPRLNELARRVVSDATPDDLILPPAQAQLLDELIGHVQFRTKVFGEWKYAPPNGRGLGVAALFAGPSGTGKTLAAEVLAGRLDLDLYHIDLSQVVSKYIGETERNLRRVFDAAEDGGAVLLFDEADALFGRRTEVKDSHDRYANIEVSYLLQRMEEYRGLAILTTNQKEAMDPAFLRRLRFVVPFPFPGPAERVRIWERAVPPDSLADVRFDALARLAVPGGSIRNIAVSAAFLAAGERVKVGMRHLLRAAQVECAKTDRVPTDAETGGWV